MRHAAAGLLLIGLNGCGSAVTADTDAGAVDLPDAGASLDTTTQAKLAWPA
jgi:hypothetical protein